MGQGEEDEVLSFGYMHFETPIGQPAYANVEFREKILEGVKTMGLDEIS